MKKKYILKSQTLKLILLLNFAAYSQNLISFDSKVDKSTNNDIFLKATDQYIKQISFGNELVTVKSDAVEFTNPVIKSTQSPYAGIVSKCPSDGVLLPNFSKITQPTMPVEVKIVSVINGDCQKGALVTIETTGGTGPYSYAATVAPAVTSVFVPNNVLELPAPGENWNIIVKDSQGCTFVLNQMTTIDPNPVIDLSTINKCADQNTFVLLVIEATSGTEAYNIKIGNGIFTRIAGLPYDIMVLTSGFHEITIQDANGCSDKKSIKIDAPLKVTPIITKLPICNTNTGEVILEPYGGSRVLSPGDYEIHKG